MSAPPEAATYSRPRHAFLRRVETGGEGIGLVDGTAPDVLVRERAVTCLGGEYRLTDYGVQLLDHWDRTRPWRQVQLTHTADDGTVLAGTRYGDGAWAMLRGAWEWQPDTGTYVLCGSVGQDADLVTIARSVRALRLIGFHVATDVDLT
jgi:hypothetical protein